MTAARLGAGERQAALAALPAWRHDAQRDAIARSFRFADFRAAFGFMTHVALAAERLNHHPEWCNVFDRVDIVLTTHDAGGLSALDLALARIADAAYAAHAAHAAQTTPAATSD